MDLDSLMQREADELRHASKEEMKADLAQRVRCYPCGLDDVVAKTVEEDIAIHHIADRCTLSPMTGCAEGDFYFSAQPANSVVSTV